MSKEIVAYSLFFMAGVIGVVTVVAAAAVVVEVARLWRRK